jgi:flavodoxin
MAKILVVYCSLTGNTKAAATQVALGARTVAGVQAVVKPAGQAEPKDLEACDGVAFGSYDAFNYMGGALKDFFDRTFYPTQHHITGKPFVAFVTHAAGGQAVQSIESLAASFQLRKAAKSLVLQEPLQGADLIRLQKLGAQLAEAIAR